MNTQEEKRCIAYFPFVDPSKSCTSTTASFGRHKDSNKIHTHRRLTKLSIKINDNRHMIIEDQWNSQMRENPLPIKSIYIYQPQRRYVNTNTFYKLWWSSKYNCRIRVFSFYKSLQHMASIYGIPLQDLEDIDEHNGVCPLISDNCKDYDRTYKMMSGASFYKINNATLWVGYD